jgi:hypothetical protein
MNRVIINDLKVRPIRTQKGSGLPLRINQAFPSKENNIPNIVLIGPKYSGKTSLINTILDLAVDDDTKVIFFVQTIENDEGYKAIMDKLEARGIATFPYKGIVEDDQDESGRPVKINRVAQWLDFIESGDDQKIEDKYAVPKKRKLKFRRLPYIMVFDDIGLELSNKWVSDLIKRNRHMGILPILSSQNLKDVAPQARRNNVDYYCLFPRLSDHILETVHAETALAMPFEQFREMYNNATKSNEHGFLYMATTGLDFRKNLNEKYIIKT